MGDAFLAALAADLARTQRLLPANCLFCVPQARSLVADAPITPEDLHTHFLVPLGSSRPGFAAADDDGDSGGDQQDPGATDGRPGEYETLNGKTVVIAGSQLHTGRGFAERRRVRILLSETRDIQHQAIVVLHLSRPLVGGLVLPEDPDELDVATFRRYMAILRSFPENELAFYQLDETIAQVTKICRQRQFVARYETTLPHALREEWAMAVEEIALGYDDDDGNGGSRRRRPSSVNASHLLQIQQVVECYLMEHLHDHIFPLVMVSCRDDDRRLVELLHRMRHYAPGDFGIRREFQCALTKARDELVHIERRRTPLEMLLAFKNCINHINDAVTARLKRHHHALDRFQMTTDDILDGLLFVIVQAFNKVTASLDPDRSRDVAEAFPLVSVLKYVTDYHFINSNTSALGYTIANFQVAVEYFLMRSKHAQGCHVCFNQGPELPSDVDEMETLTQQPRCSQAIAKSTVEQAFERNHKVWSSLRESRSLTRKESRLLSGFRGSDGDDQQALFVVGNWLSEGSPSCDSHTVDQVAGSSAVHQISLIANDATPITQISCGHRFFAFVNDEGRVLTWGDRTGGRLGYSIVEGGGRRVEEPRIVSDLMSIKVLQVSCGGFHALATDVNGHVFAWGQNARGQLGFLTPSLETTTVRVPTLVADLKGIYIGAVACGQYHSLGLSSDGRVFSWGCNAYDKLGRSSSSLMDAVQPQALQASLTARSVHGRRVLDLDVPQGAVRRIVAGRDHSLAVTCDGVVFSWGRGDSGQLGHGSFMDIPEPTQVLAIADDDGALVVMDASAGDCFSLFLLRDGTVFISGRDPANPDEFPEAKDQDEDAHGHENAAAGSRFALTPRLLALGSDLKAHVGHIIGIACGAAHYTLLTESGEVLHLDESSATDAPPESADVRPQRRRLRRLEGITNASRVRAGGSHTLVLRG